MMGKMRDMTKWILYILILAFVGLMVIEWGADYSGLMQQQQSVVGEINGEEVSLQQYTMAVSNARAMEERRTGNTLDEAAVADLRDRVWEELVQRVVLKTQLEKMDISVTDDDVTNYILNSLTQQYSNDPNFQTNGRFDRDKLNQVLTQPENANLLISMEYQAKEDLPYAKLVDLINASVIVTEQELRDEFAQTNQKAKIDFVGVATTAFRNDSLNISDADLKAYYDKNKDDFKVEETRKLKYVFFSKTPTAEDSARVVDAINQLKAEAESGKDFATLALTESEDPSAQTNSGDLGFFDRNAMVKEFADAAFSAEPGTFVGPVQTRFGLHLIHVIEKKMEDGVEKVHAAHILKTFEAGIGTIDEANNNANGFVSAVENDGFEAVAKNRNLTPQETAAFSHNRNGQIPGVGRQTAAMNWAFSSEKGSVSEVFFTDNGNYVFKIEDIIPAGFRPLDEVKTAVKRRVENEKRMALAKAHAEQLSAKVQSGASFTDIAAGDEKVTADTTDYFTKNIFVPKIGRAPGIVAAAFSLEIGQTSDLIETDRGYYYVRVKDHTAFDETAYANQKSALKNRLLQQKARSVFDQWYQQLKEEATVVDNRFRFFRG